MGKLPYLVKEEEEITIDFLLEDFDEETKDKINNLITRIDKDNHVDILNKIADVMNENYKGEK